KKYDVLVLLSGPEPQRTMLEVKMMEVFLNSDKKVLLVRGIVEEREEILQNKNITIFNFLQSKELENAINESEVVVSRSGYTTIMDLAALEKDAYFIPTPGQFEQKYLAKELKGRGIVPSCKQHEFTLEKLKEIPLYKGLKEFAYEVNFKKLFALFEGK
ncbi:MAG TPA: glycosyltransferase, partial [Flavobacteriaceae bacterium]|nr:glycosyltransferase [Flavobacteriaceae bacterium]